MMSHEQQLFLGPYAVFPVPRAVARQLPVGEDEEPIGWRSFFIYGDERAGRAYYMPRGEFGEPPREAPRKMYWGGFGPWEPSLIGMDPRAELAWFAREYAAELA